MRFKVVLPIWYKAVFRADYALRTGVANAFNVSDEEIAAIVDAVVTETGASGMQQMGQVMKGVQAQVAGRADGGRIAPLVKARLQG